MNWLNSTNSPIQLIQQTLIGNYLEIRSIRAIRNLFGFILLGHMFFYFLYRLGYFIANVLSLRAAYWLAEMCADVRYFVAKKDREAVAENISIVLKKDIEECSELAQKVFRNFGLYLVDFFRIGKVDKENIKRRVKIDGLEAVDGILKEEKKGIIVLTCHIGNWEMGGVVMGIMGYDIWGVALTHKYKRINDFFIRQREQKGMKVIVLSSVMKRCVSVLLRGGILALIGDRDFTNSGITIDLFGMPTSIPKGPALLSLKTNTPIVPAFFIRENRFNYRFIFDKPIEVKERPGVEKDTIIKEATQKLVAIMEGYIKKYPEQWLLFRRFWESPVDAVVL